MIKIVLHENETAKPVKILTLNLDQRQPALSVRGDVFRILYECEEFSLVP